MILVTGATGFIGRNLTRRLLRADEEVRIVTRNESRIPADWHGQLEVVVGDVANPDVQQEALRGIRAVYGLAAEIRDPLTMRRVNVDAAGALARLAGEAGVTQIVHLSSVGVIGASRTGTITEDEPCVPRTLYEQTKLEGEQQFLSACHENGVHGLVARPTIVFGEGTAPNRDSLLSWLRAVKSGRFFMVGRKAVANYVYVDDVVDAMLEIAAVPPSTSPVWIIADPTTMQDFVFAMAAALGVEPPGLVVPVLPAYIAGGALELVGQFLGTSVPLSRSRVRALSSRCRFSSDKLRNAGITPRVGYRSGLLRTVAWHRHEGRL